MVIKQLEDGRYVLWCPACQDNHVTDASHKLMGSLSAPTLKPALYDWDDKNVCHLLVDQGQLLYLPDCTHDYAERTIPMPHLPIWMLEDRDYAPEPEVENDVVLEPDDTDLNFEFDTGSEGFDDPDVATWDPKLGWIE
jgi:hypothetical protein